MPGKTKEYILTGMNELTFGVGVIKSKENLLKSTLRKILAKPM